MNCFKITIIGLLLISGFYFSLKTPVHIHEVLEVSADTATTSLEVGNSVPSVSSVNLNSGSNVDLSEDGSVVITATGTVTDNNGYSDISSVIGRIYRSGVTSTEACSLDDNNCYEDSSCSTSSCSGSDCVASCSWTVWFHAEPTDAGSDWSGEYWMAWIKAIDSSSASSSATNSAQTIEMNTLTAIDISDSIDYGSLSPGQTNDPLDKLLLATTTGNEAIDANISGTNMCTDYPTCSVATTSITNQHYATTGVAYASGHTASSSAVLLEFLTTKPVDHPSSQAQSIYWGTRVPTSTAIGSYTGVNTFSAQSD